MVPWLSVVVPTVGRPTLPRLLDSMDRQEMSGNVQVVLVGDTHGGRTRQIESAKSQAYDRGPRYLWVEHDGGMHAWGHPQRMEGMRRAAAPWIAFSQDDNILAKGAFASIWHAIVQTPRPQPLLFKVRTWQAGVVWKLPAVQHGNVDADCIVIPNEPDRWGNWELVYEGDFHFIRQTVERWGGAVGWHPEVIAYGHPTPEEDWTLAG